MHPAPAPFAFEPYIGADTLELRHAVQRRRRMHARDAWPARGQPNGAEPPCRTVAEFKRRLLEDAAADFGFGQEWL